MEATAFSELKRKLWKFMKEDIYPNEQLFAKQSLDIGERSNEWVWSPILVELKRKAKAQGLWNLFLPVDSAAAAGAQGALGGGLTNLQYAQICEIMGTSCHMEFAAQATNCTSPEYVFIGLPPFSHCDLVLATWRCLHVMGLQSSEKNGLYLYWKAQFAAVLP